jgi:hypothetical protein
MRSFETVQCILSSILCPSLLLCPINATSSFSYVFRLQYPRVLHCRIVPIEKVKTLVAVGKKNPPVNHLGSKEKQII